MCLIYKYSNQSLEIVLIVCLFFRIILICSLGCINYLASFLVLILVTNVMCVDQVFNPNRIQLVISPTFVAWLQTFVYIVYKNREFIYIYVDISSNSIYTYIYDKAYTHRYIDIKDVYISWILCIQTIRQLQRRQRNASAISPGLVYLTHTNFDSSSNSLHCDQQ